MPRPARPTLCRSSRAFTLIELLVVIVILGILMAVAVPTFLRQQTKAQDSRTEQYLTTAFKAIRASTPENGNQYPTSTSMVSWISQSEPELTAVRGSCTTGVQTAQQDAVLVDTASSANQLTLCSRSQSGHIWKLTASATGQQTLLDGTLVPLTFSGTQITDANRAVQGDGRVSDASTGIWEATTNLLPNGGFENGTSSWAGWAHTGFNPVPTISQDSTHVKFGSKALKVVTQGANANEGVITATAGGTVSAGTTYTVSAWVYSAASQQFQFGIDWKDSGGTYLSSSNSLTTVNGGTWTRLTQTATAPASSNFLTVTVYANNGAPTPTTFWIDGVQAEQKAIVTPYVDTNGTTATRSAASVQAPGSVADPNTGWAVVRFRDDTTADHDYMLAYFSRLNSTSYYIYRQQGGPNRVWSMQQSTGGSQGVVDNTNPAGKTYTLIGAWSPSTLSMSVNGSAFLSAARSDGTPGEAVQSIYFGSSTGNNSICDCDIFWAAVGAGTLTDADAATINGWGNTVPTIAAFPAAAKATMVWNGASSTGSLK